VFIILSSTWYTISIPYSSLAPNQASYGDYDLFFTTCGTPLFGFIFGARRAGASIDTVLGQVVQLD